MTVVMARGAFTLFPLIGAKLPDFCPMLVNIPDCNFWIHEKQLAAYLCLPQGPKHRPSDAVTVIMACLKRGYGGNKRKNTFIATGVPTMGLSDNSNRVCFHFNGREEDFVGGNRFDTAVPKKPRWFRFGRRCVINVKEQTQIGRELTRDIPVNENSSFLLEGAHQPWRNTTFLF